MSVTQLLVDFDPRTGPALWIGMSTALALGYAALFLAYRVAWDLLPERSPEKDAERAGEGDTAPSTRFTVIVPARDERGRIGRCVTALRQQDYPGVLYEILVVDDHSSDGTAAEAAKAGGEKVRVIDLASRLAAGSGGLAYKKKAIEVAVAEAKGEWIATTDADAVPPAEWLSRIAAAVETENWKLVAGPVTLFPRQDMLARWQDLDLISLVGIAGASIRMGFHNLCNGANLAYSKTAFQEVGGFRDIDDQPSGDDMMLMHKIGRTFPDGVGFLKDRHAIVRTDAEPDLASLWTQRLRWASKSTRYEDWRITALLAGVWMFNLSIPLNMLMGFLDPMWFRLGLAQFLVKITADTVFQVPVTRFFGKTRLLWSFLSLQVAHVIYVVAMGPVSTFFPYRWKGRRVPAAASRRPG